MSQGPKGIVELCVSEESRGEDKKRERNRQFLQPRALNEIEINT